MKYHEHIEAGHRLVHLPEVSISDERKKDFLEAIVAVCQEYGVSLGHEDEAGAFQIREYDEAYSAWVRSAYVATQPLWADEDGRIVE